MSMVYISPHLFCCCSVWVERIRRWEQPRRVVSSSSSSVFLSTISVVDRYRTVEQSPRIINRRSVARTSEPMAAVAATVLLSVARTTSDDGGVATDDGVVAVARTTTSEAVAVTDAVAVVYLPA